MESERWHEVDRLFLDAVCACDTALRQEVERLLAADAQGSSFLAGPPEELLRLALDDREDGGSLGPYRLLRRIGGGVGSLASLVAKGR